MTNSPDPLDDLIASWKEVPAASAGMRRRVWARIDSAEKRRRPSLFFTLRSAFAVLVRERAAIAWVTACIALGLVSAELRATRLPMHDLQQIATAYLQTINPLLRH
ncbi:MAG: hypothetical protein QM691_13235 [Opitutaceae bacterium]